MCLSQKSMLPISLKHSSPPNYKIVKEHITINYLNENVIKISLFVKVL